MYSAISVTQAISKHFLLNGRKSLTEPVVQAHLYNIQKEAYRQTGKPLIKEQFFAGPDGPFIPMVRDGFPSYAIFQEPEEMDAVSIRVIETTLASPSRPPVKDFAWRKARVPLTPSAEKAKPIQEEWIAEEVARERVRDERIGMRA